MAPKKLLVDAVLHQTKGNVDLSESVVVLDPNNQRVSIAPGSDDIAVDKAGFYQIRTMNMNVSVAVNAQTRESDLTHGNAEEMTAGWMSLESSVFPQDEHHTPEEQDHRQRLWALLLTAAALFLIMELALSNYELRSKKEA